jgi:predicted double-glycine peptidase
MTLTEILQALETCACNLRAIIDAQPTHLLGVPFRSQHDPDGDQHKSDCGPACVAMLLEYAGVRVDINTLAREAGMSTTKRYTLPADLIRAANLHGLKIERRTDCTIDMLRSAIALHCPPIVLIHYGSLGTLRQDRAWNGGHWVVVVGVSDDTIYVHDPDWQGEQRSCGQNLAIPRAIFEDAWAKCNVDGNTPHQGLWVVSRPYQHETGGTTITPAMVST